MAFLKISESEVKVCHLPTSGKSQWSTNLFSEQVSKNAYFCHQFGP